MTAIHDYQIPSLSETKKYFCRLTICGLLETGMSVGAISRTPFLEKKVQIKLHFVMVPSQLIQ